MKLRFVQGVIATAALGFILMAVPTRAQDEPKPDAPKQDEPKPDTATQVVVVAPATDAQTVVVNPPVPATNAAPAPFQFPKLGLPPLLDQVVKLSQSGTDEKVIRSYIEKAAPAYRITGNEIVQLRDLGISQ